MHSEKSTAEKNCSCSAAASAEPLKIQRKLSVGAEEDPLEEEADHTAEMVMRMPKPVAVQRKCDCEEKEQVHRKPINSFIQKKDSGANTAVSNSVASQIQNTRGSGSQMDSSAKSFMESRFNTDFSNINIHNGHDAAKMAGELNAQAFTVGNDIYFNEGRYSPGSNAGKHLLAHELTHVIQQGGAEKSIQRKLDCSLDHLTRECGGADASCMTVQKDYCAKQYPSSKEISELHERAVTGIESYKSKLPNAASNFLYFLAASGKEKTMPVDLFKNHSATKEQLETVHRIRILEGARKRLDPADGRLKVGGTAEIAWTDTANAFDGSEDDLGLSVGGYTICSKVIVSATKNGADTEISFKDWTVQAFDCYNWDPGKGIALFGGVKDKDLCCLQNAGKGKHFRIRTDPWQNNYAPSLVKGIIKPTATTGTGGTTTPPPKKDKSDDR